MKLLTFGYLGHSAAALAAALATIPNALLVDVRLVPFARDRRWARTSLAMQFGGRYRHLRTFGNRNYKKDSAPIELEDVPAGVRALLAVTRPMLDRGEPTVVLLCACRARAGCHRDVVAAELVRQLGAIDQGELTIGPPAPHQLALW